MRHPPVRGRDTLVGGAIAVLSLGSLAISGFDQRRWPWVFFCWLAAAPYLLLLVPPVAGWLRARVAAERALSYLVPAALALFGVAVTVAAGAFRWEKLALWPLCTLAVVALVARDSAATPSGPRLVAAAVVLGILAGAWERTLYIRVPGGTKIGLAFFVALDLALFFYLAVKPLRTFDVGFGLSARTLGAAALALGALVLVALPVGLGIGFLEWETRWQGWGYAAARVFGLVLFVGLPEEMLFRGLIQEGLSRIWSPVIGWILGSALFGLAHLPKHAPPLNWRYAAVATLAGLAYGWVYLRTRKLAAAALTHGAADWTWDTVLGS